MLNKANADVSYRRRIVITICEDMNVKSTRESGIESKGKIVINFEKPLGTQSGVENIVH